MKRTIALFILVALVLIACALWQSKVGVPLGELASWLVISLLVILGLFLGWRRLRSIRRREPAEDELSRKIMVRTSSVSYYLSLYLWLGVGFFSDRLHLENHTLIGLGIVGMALLFTLTWIFFNFRGIGNE